MKFSNETLTVLKSFTSINKSILLAKGTVLKTITPEKTLIAIANIDQEIPSDACIYDLSRFLSILSLYNDPDVVLLKDLEYKRRGERDALHRLKLS